MWSGRRSRLRDLLLYLRDIRTACQKILRFTDGQSYEEFLGDEVVYDATLRNLTVIGEAVKAVPPEMRDRYPDVEWRRIAGFRDIAVHVYFGIDNETLWDIIRNRLPALLARIEEILEVEADELSG